MMVETILQTFPKARKEHDCMASEWLNQCGNLRGLTFTFSEWRAIIKARDNNWTIKKGEVYTNQRNVQDGEIFTFKSITAIHEICCKYDYYDI